MPLPTDILASVLKTLSDNKSVLVLLATSAIGSGLGAWFGAGAILWREKAARQIDIRTTANVSIAALVALLGKLINFKKDLAFPASAEAETLFGVLAEISKGNGEKNQLSIKLELWPETNFDLKLPSGKIYEYAGQELDLVQLMKMLEYNLSELTHLVAERNNLIRRMNGHQSSKGKLPQDGLQLYMKYADKIARNVDENLFFIDKAIEKIRAASKKLLPKKLHNGIADVGLRPETQPLMPPKDFLKGWVK